MKTDDPKLTAYALGEIPPAERAEIEALLREDTALAAELEATRAFAAQLRTELQAEEGAPLSAHQHSEVLALANAQSASAKVIALRVWPRRLLKIAATLLVVGGVVALLFPGLSVQQKSARKIADQIRPSDPVLRDGGKSVTAESLADEASSIVMSHMKSASPDSEAKWASQPGAIRPYSNASSTDFFALYPDSQMPAPVPGLAEFDKDGVVVGKEVKALAQVSAAQPAQPATSAQPSDPSFGLPMSIAKSGTGSLVAGEKVELAVSLGDMQRKTAAGDSLVSIAKNPEPRLASGVPRPELQVAEAAAEFSIHARSEVQMTEAAGVPAPVKAWASTPMNAGQPSGTGGLAFTPEQRTQAYRYIAPPGESDSLGTDRDSRFRQLTGNTEAYDAITDNAFLPVKDQPLSTLSIDVDTASYANVRRFLTAGSLPPKGAVRIEEMLNYFPYDYPQPAGDAPFSATMEVAACPWTPEHRLVRIGLKGRDLARSERPAANLVFLIDVSGSMQPANKLPLVKESLRLLVDQLDDRDLVAIAVYAGASGTVLEPTRDKAAMRAALDRLEAGGSTNGAGGIQLAYELAAKSFIKGGTNRVILATDGDFNVGITSQSDLVDLIEKKAKSGVFLSVLGYGMGNLKDSTLEKLADKGNGNYGYIDTLAEAKKTLVEQMNGTLYTIAKDVKIQVEFNPAHAAAYRLIGYENRLLAKEDFNNDKKDAGEIGAGHSVTALYEIVPAGGAVPGVAPAVDELKYTSKPASASAPVKSQISNPQPPISNPPPYPELLTLKLRYKMPDGDVSAKLEFPLTDRGETWEKSSPDFRWAAAVASFGMLLRDSPHKGRSTWDSTLELAHEGRGDDRTGYRAECLGLIEKARAVVR